MKIMKRITTVILSAILLVPFFSSTAKAAGDSVVFFSDLETSVGATFTVTGTVVSRAGAIGNVSVQMLYDTAFMRYVSGDSVTDDGNGQLTYTGSGDGGSDRIEFTVEFQALQEGSSRIEQGNASVTDINGVELECDPGFADVTIGPGDPSLIQQPTSSATVEVEGQSYTVSGEFSATMIPQGFSEGEFIYDGSTFKGAVQPNSGITLAYLTDGFGASDFWVYDESNGSFSPCEEMMISDTYSILIMDGTKILELPEEYEISAIQISGKEIPAWIAPDREGFSVLYGVNSDGDDSLYMYDTLEHTFQRMEIPETASGEKDGGAKSEGALSKLGSFITKNLLWVVVTAVCALCMLLVLLTVLAVKLMHRNHELDDLYEEFGIEEEGELPVQKKKDRGIFKKDMMDEDYDEDAYYDELDEDYGEDDEEYDDLSDLKRDYKLAEKSAKSYDEYYDDEDFEEDVSEGRSGHGRSSREDTYELDFIDLD